MNNDINNLMNNPKIKEAFNKLDPKKQKQLNEIISNEDEINRLLNTPQAQLILKKLMEK